MVLIKVDTEEVREKLEEIESIREETETELEPVVNELRQSLNKSEVDTWLDMQSNNELEIIKSISTLCKINLTEAMELIPTYPSSPIVGEQQLPDLVKEMRNIRRGLKGNHRESIAKGIDHLITAYQEYINKCIKSIYWLRPYRSPLLDINLSESKIKKLYSIKDGERREIIIDNLCKMWNAKLDRRNLDYGSEYSKLSKEISEGKKEISGILRGITPQEIRKSRKELIQEEVLDLICNNPGITSSTIFERLDSKYSRYTTPAIIAKMAKGIGATKIDDEYYLIKSLIKKDLYSYVAGFIDSDGYITMDSKFSPRVGMVATGNRGKAFFTELESELKCGRLHLDQKAGENNRSQHRLNFYSANDIGVILEKCIPHLRMKKSQGKLVREALRIKKNHKKQPWAKERLNEIFQLIKYENWKDARNSYELDKYGVNPETVVKYFDNCKNNVMDELESIIKEE
tara:strand:- start:106 stop:1482 length:1377 start_codon:yes stop_codon:yes gene_type:complete